MKKYLILALSLGVSACACFNGACDDEVIVKEKNAPVYEVRNVKRVYQKPAPVYILVDEEQENPNIYARGVRYRNNESNRRYVRPTLAPVQSPCQQQANNCQGHTTETREPVEIVYKKTVKTISYEPKVTENISYEKETFTSSSKETYPAPVDTYSEQREVIVETISDDNTRKDNNIRYIENVESTNNMEYNNQDYVRRGNSEIIITDDSPNESTIRYQEIK